MTSVTTLSILTVLAGWILCLFVLGLGAAVIWLIARDRINLCKLISESNGDASMSRFQLLVFTFVVALSFFLVVAANPQKLPDVPGSVLSLIGISASSYLVSKGIQSGSENRTLTVSPSGATVQAGHTQQFKATVSIDSQNKVVWSIQAGTGTITQEGLYTAPPAAAPDAAAAGAAAPTARAYATIKATSIVDPSLVDLAIVTLA